MGFDRVSEALAHRARRQVLLELMDHNPVAQQAVVAGNDVRADDELELALVHNHLPKLESLDYIVWERDDGDISKGPNWEQIEPVVRLLDDNRDQLPTDTF